MSQSLVALVALFVLMHSATATASRWTTPLHSYVIGKGAYEILQLGLSENASSPEKIMSLLNKNTTKIFYDVDQNGFGTDVKQERDLNIRSGSLLYRNSPLFYLTSDQREAAEYARRDAVAIPDLTLENLSTVWIGRCLKEDYSLPDGIRDMQRRYQGGSGFYSIFNEAILAALQQDEEHHLPVDNRGFVSRPTKGFITGGTVVEGLITDDRLMAYSTLSGEIKNLNPRNRTDFGYDSLEDRSGAVFLFGRLRGPAPIHVARIEAFGSLELGRLKGAQVALFSGGNFIVLMPCAKFSALKRVPMVISLQIEEKSPFYVPIRMVDSDRLPNGQYSSVMKFPKLFRVGIRPSSWENHALIRKNKDFEDLLDDPLERAKHYLYEPIAKDAAFNFIETISRYDSSSSIELRDTVNDRLSSVLWGLNNP